MSRYPVSSIGFKIIPRPAAAPHPVYGKWHIKSHKVAQKCYKVYFHKKMFNLCHSVRATKKCRRVTTGKTVKAQCLTIDTIIKEHYNDVHLINGGFKTDKTLKNDHNGVTPKGWTNVGGLRVDTLSAELKLQGVNMLKVSHSGGYFVRLNSNNIIIKQLTTKVTGFELGYRYTAVFEQALLYNWGHCDGNFRIQLGDQVSSNSNKLNHCFYHHYVSCLLRYIHYYIFINLYKIYIFTLYKVYIIQ